jgi:polyribonucleotide nucleotidyltransferase
MRSQRNYNSRGTSSQIKVSTDKIGLVIGRGGATIKSISQEVGDGCYIKHDRDNKGTFIITAKTQTAIDNAKKRITEIINYKPQRFQYSQPSVPTIKKKIPIKIEDASQFPSLGDTSSQKGANTKSSIWSSMSKNTMSNILKKEEQKVENKSYPSSKLVTNTNTKNIGIKRRYTSLDLNSYRSDDIYIRDGYGDDEDYYSNDEYLDDYQPLVLSDDESNDVVVF